MCLVSDERAERRDDRERPRGEGRGPRRDRSERDRRSDDRRDERRRDERPSRSRDDRPYRPRDERPARGAEDRPARGRDERPTRSREDRPARSGEDRPYRGRDDRPSRGNDERAYRGRDDRPARGRDDRGREDRPFRGRDDRSGRDRFDRSGDRRPDRREREDRPREPELPDDIEAGQLDKVLRSELLTLSKDNADGTARHLVAVGRALDEEDFDRALLHAQAATRRAGRVAGVRETLGVVHYRRGEWAKALAEFRTARRLSGLDHLLPLMADAERGLGRPERALDLAATPEAARLPAAERVEMAIVVSGARIDLGQTAAAVQHLRDLARAGSPKAPWAARLRYAYAAALEADGQVEDAQEWYRRAAEVDETGETDAAEVLGWDDEPEFLDLADDDEQDGPAADGEQVVASADEPTGGAPASDDGSVPGDGPESGAGSSRS